MVRLSGDGLGEKRCRLNRTSYPHVKAGRSTTQIANRLGAPQEVQ